MKTRIVAVLATVTMLALPLTALAHEHRSYTIGHKEYSITMGSMNEPVYVGDKSGVEFTITGPADVPVTGLESTLTIEVSAGDEKMTLTPKAAFGEPGSYYAVFYPSRQTTFVYRLKGTIDNVAFDVPFPCKPAETETAPEDTSETKISDGVTQTHKSGAFGCPLARTTIEFPKTSSADGGNDALAITALALSAVAMAFSLGSLGKSRKKA